MDSVWERVDQIHDRLFNHQESFKCWVCGGSMFMHINTPEEMPCHVCAGTGTLSSESLLVELYGEIAAATSKERERCARIVDDRAQESKENADRALDYEDYANHDEWLAVSRRERRTAELIRRDDSNEG